MDYTKILVILFALALIYFSFGTGSLVNNSCQYNWDVTDSNFDSATKTLTIPVVYGGIGEGYYCASAKSNEVSLTENNCKALNMSWSDAGVCHLQSGWLEGKQVKSFGTWYVQCPDPRGCAGLPYNAEAPQSSIAWGFEAENVISLPSSDNPWRRARTNGYIEVSIPQNPVQVDIPSSSVPSSSSSSEVVVSSPPTRGSSFFVQFKLFLNKFLSYFKR